MDNIKKIDDELKLIYIHKIGYDAKGNGLYEFIFSKDPTNIDCEGWCWDLSPACDNAMPPTENYIDKIFSLKTSTFNLFCLHEAVDREYMHGYHTIHALAFEIPVENQEEGFNSYDNMYNEDLPILVFHYGTSLSRIKDMLLTRKFILRNNEFVEISSTTIDN